MTGVEPQGRPAESSRALNPCEAFERAGLSSWQWAQAIAMHLVPTEERSRPHVFSATWPNAAAWPAAVVDDAVARRAEILAAVGDEPPIGGVHAAARLAARTGLQVAEADVATLTEDGLVTVVAEDEVGCPLWACSGLDALPHEAVAEVVSERLAWLEDGVTLQEGAELLGWPEADVERLADERLLQYRWERYARSDIEALPHPYVSDDPQKVWLAWGTD